MDRSFVKTFLNLNDKRFFFQAVVVKTYFIVNNEINLMIRNTNNTLTPVIYFIFLKSHLVIVGKTVQNGFGMSSLINNISQ